MKKIAIAALAGVLVIAACGGASSAPAAAQGIQASPAAPTAAAATQAPATQAVTRAPATQAAASAPAAAGTPRKVVVTATNSLYSISTLEVKPGEKMEFVMTNNGDEKHNMVGIGEGISIVSPDFDAGQTISWIWTAPIAPGTFKLICAYHKEVPPVTVTVK